MENNNKVNEVTDQINEMVNNGVLFSALAYIPFLWLLGLLIAPAKNSPFVKAHVNNGIIITIVGVVLGVVGKILSIIPVIGFIAGIIFWILGIGLLVIAILGIINACQKKSFLLPVIGDSIKIVK